MGQGELTTRGLLGIRSVKLITGDHRMVPDRNIVEIAGVGEGWRSSALFLVEAEVALRACDQRRFAESLHTDIAEDSSAAATSSSGRISCSCGDVCDAQE